MTKARPACIGHLPPDAKETMLKKDMSFIEHPLYFLSNKYFTDEKVKKGKDAYTAKVWRSGNYWVECQAGIPNEYDYTFLVYWLILSQQQGFKPVIEVSIRDILKGCGIDPGSHWYYKRVKQSLEVWERVRFHFEKDSFRYKDNDGKGYITRFKELHAGVVSNWGIINGTTVVRISLDEQFLEVTKDSRFYKNIIFADIKELRGEPTAIRLHEILLKSFEASDVWEIGAKKLGKKLTIPDEYPSRINKKVEAALTVINEKTRHNFTMQYYDRKAGVKIPKFQFQIIRQASGPAPEIKTQASPTPKKDNIFIQAQLPFGEVDRDPRRKDILEVVDFFYEYIATKFPGKLPADLEDEKSKAYETLLELIEADGLELAYIKEVLVFAVNDSFWKTKFYTLTTLKDISENGNTLFGNMENASKGIRNPSSQTTASAGSTRQDKNMDAVLSFINEEG